MRSVGSSASSTTITLYGASSAYAGSKGGWGTTNDQIVPWPDTGAHRTSIDRQYRAHGARWEPRRVTRSTPLHQQLAACRPGPELGRVLAVELGEEEPRRHRHLVIAPSPRRSGIPRQSSVPAAQLRSSSALVGTPSPLVTRQLSAPSTCERRRAAHLANSLEHEVEPVDVRLRHPAAARVRRQPPVGPLERAVVGERGALTAAAEAVALEGQRHEWAERVVDLRDLHVGGPELGALPEARAAAAHDGPFNGSSLK